MSFSQQAVADHLRQRIRGNRLLELPAPWADELIFPHYDGLSIYNVIHSIGELFGAPLPGSRPLDRAVWDGGFALGAIDRVILIISDGLGYTWLSQFLEEDEALRQVVHDLSGGRGPLPLTSTTPSTTSSALTTIWTGASPAAHGMTSFIVHLREIGMLAVPLFFCPAGNLRRRDSLEPDFGLVPEEFVPVPGLAEHLAHAGIPTHISLRYDYMNSAISRILHRGVPPENQHAHRNSFDTWTRLADLLRATAGQRCYVNVYWPGVDDISHHYGSDTPQVRTEIKRQLTELRNVLADDSLHDGRTLVILTADHGHTNPPHTVNLRGTPEAAPIEAALHTHFAGEARLPYLYIRPGHRQTVIDTIEQQFAETFTWVDAELALQAGLFGPEPPYAETPYRIGDLILVPRTGWKLAGGRMPAPPLISYHGGMSEQEMLIPMLYTRL